MIAESHCGLSIETQKRLQYIFQRYSSLERVILYGSRAKGTYKTGSDVDLAIESKDLTLEELHSIQNAIDDLLLPYKIDLSLLRMVDNPQLLEHVATVGLVFYQKLKDPGSAQSR